MDDTNRPEPAISNVTGDIATRVADLIDDYLLGWVLLSAALGLTIPSLAALTPYSIPILAVMIGAVSLTLSPERFRRLRARPLLTVLVVQSGMPLLAFVISLSLGLSPAITAGFVVLGAVTPELVTPTMTELSGGDTALATVTLVSVGLGTLMFVPGMVALLLGQSVAVNPLLIVEQLVLAVVLPMTVAVGLRYRWPERVGRYDGLYPSVSSLMVIIIIGIVIAANASLIRSNGSLLLVVATGALVLNGVGYAAGWLASRPFERTERIAATLSVGMRDFAVAAALLVGAGFPPAATLPAIVFGIIEMMTSAGLARWFARNH